MRTAYRGTGWSLAMGLLLAVVIVISATIGPVTLPAEIVLFAVLDALPLVSVAVPDTARLIVVNVRLPRIALAALVGFALAAAGTVMQGFFRNPMADPSIIGVSAGAAVGAVATITFGPILPYGITLAAFIGGLIAAFGVYLIATEDGRTPVATLLLAGIAVQTFLGAVVSWLILHSGHGMEEALLWLMGHLRFAGWNEVRTLLIVIPPLFLILLAYSKDLNVLLLGEEEAQTLGVEVEWTKRLLLAVAALLTAAAVSFTGIIGFVGLVVPHMLRLIVGPDHRVLLPTSAIGGAAFLVATDTIARSGPAELPVGIVTAAIGAPFFLYLLRTREVHSL